MRYYPDTSLTQASIISMLNQFTCVGGTTDCTGPDHTSVKFIRLTEKNFEYKTFAEGGEGKEYFKILGTHPVFLNHNFNEENYQMNMWTILDEPFESSKTVLYRLQNFN